MCSGKHAASPSTDAVDFRFINYNPVRASRGAVAVQVAVIIDGEERWLWMSKDDIARNIAAFGMHPELFKARSAYGGPCLAIGEKENQNG